MTKSLYIRTNRARLNNATIFKNYWLYYLNAQL